MLVLAAIGTGSKNSRKLRLIFFSVNQIHLQIVALNLSVGRFFQAFKYLQRMLAGMFQSARVVDDHGRQTFFCSIGICERIRVRASSCER